MIIVKATDIANNAPTTIISNNGSVADDIVVVTSRTVISKAHLNLDILYQYLR